MIPGDECGLNFSCYSQGKTPENSNVNRIDRGSNRGTLDGKQRRYPSTKAEAYFIQYLFILQCRSRLFLHCNTMACFFLFRDASASMVIWYKSRSHSTVTPLPSTNSIQVEILSNSENSDEDPGKKIQYIKIN